MPRVLISVGVLETAGRPWWEEHPGEAGAWVGAVAALAGSLIVLKNDDSCREVSPQCELAVPVYVVGGAVVGAIVGKAIGRRNGWGTNPPPF